MRSTWEHSTTSPALPSCMNRPSWVMGRSSTRWGRRTRVSIDLALTLRLRPDRLGPGLKAIFEGIDNRTDFKSYMQNYGVARGTPKGPRREGPYEEGFVSASSDWLDADCAPC